MTVWVWFYQIRSTVPTTEANKARQLSSCVGSYVAKLCLLHGRMLLRLFFSQPLRRQNTNIVIHYLITHYLWVMSTFLNLVLHLTGSESSLEQNIFSLQSLVVCRQLKACYTSPALCHLLLSVSAHLDLSSLLFSVSRSLSPPSIFSQQQLAQPTGRPTAADRFDTDVMTCHGLRRKADNWFPFFSFSSCISLQNPNSSLLRSRLFVYVIFHQEVSRAADYSPPTLIGGKGCAD